MKISNVNFSYSLKGADLTLISLLDLPLDSAIQTSPYKIKSIDGLGPPDINVAIADQVDSGGTFLGNNPTNREIVLVVGFAPNYGIGQTVGDLRSALYKVLFPRFSRHLTLSLQDQGRNTLVTVLGQVKKVEPDIFSKEPQVQITIACYGPFLRKWGTQLTQISLLPTNPLPITNPGDAPSGVYMEIVFNGFTDIFSLTNENDDKLEFDYNFVHDDVLTIDTTPGRRKARMLRGTVDTNMMPYMTAESDWLQLYFGVNELQPNVQVFWMRKIILNSNYWGV